MWVIHDEIKGLFTVLGAYPLVSKHAFLVAEITSCKYPSLLGLNKI